MEVAKAKERAYDELYAWLDSKEGETEAERERWKGCEPG